jgi:hypothetical protein
MPPFGTSLPLVNCNLIAQQPPCSVAKGVVPLAFTYRCKLRRKLASRRQYCCLSDQCGPVRYPRRFGAYCATYGVAASDLLCISVLQPNEDRSPAVGGGAGVATHARSAFPRTNASVWGGERQRGILPDLLIPLAIARELDRRFASHGMSDGGPRLTDDGADLFQSRYSRL